MSEFGAGYYSSALYNTGTGLDHERVTGETPEQDGSVTVSEAAVDCIPYDGTYNC